MHVSQKYWVPSGGNEWSYLDGATLTNMFAASKLGLAMANAPPPPPFETYDKNNPAHMFMQAINDENTCVVYLMLSFVKCVCVCVGRVALERHVVDQIHSSTATPHLHRTKFAQPSHIAIKLCLHREIILLSRMKPFVIIRWIQLALLGAITGTVFLRLDTSSLSAANSMLGVLYYSLIMMYVHKQETQNILIMR